MQPQLEDSYGFQISKCGSCQGDNTDFISSPEPKTSYPQLPPIAPEVLPVGYFMPTALTYERVEPPRNFSSAPPLDALRYSGGESFLAKIMPAFITETFFPEKCCGEKFYDMTKKEHASNALENSKPTVTLYKTEWCHFCGLMKPVFEKVSQDAAATGIEFKIVDCDKTKVSFVSSYPTIIYTDTAGKSFKYNGRSDYQQLLKFVLAPSH
jgi:thiol-disulfide isomerase/thioredoxin